MYEEKTCNFSTFTNLIIISFQAVATDYVVCISSMYFVQSVVAFKSYMMKLATKTRFCTAHLQFRAVGTGLGGQGEGNHPHPHFPTQWLLWEKLVGKVFDANLNFLRVRKSKDTFVMSILKVD